MKHNIPRRILKSARMTARQWKQQKRCEARDLAQAFDRFRFASDFTPAKKFVAKIGPALVELRKSLQVKNWGN